MTLSSRQDRSTFTAALAVIGGIIWIVSPVIAIFVLWERSNSATLAESRVTWLEAERPPSIMTEDAELDLIWSSQPQVFAPTWSGVVQRVSIEAGDRLENGSEICLIDNVVRIAWSTEVPLFRPIALGDSGADVMALNRFLEAQGLPHGGGETAGWSTVQGIKQYSKLIGAGNTSSFDPAWLVYFPEEIVIEGITGLVAGAAAPTPGSAIVLGKSRLLEANLIQLSQGQLSEDGQSAATPLYVSAGQRVMIGALQLLVEQDGSVSDPATLEAISGLASAEDSRLRVTVATDVPENLIAIPYAALETSGMGVQVCLQQGQGAELTPVEVVQRAAGRAYVEGNLTVGDRVSVPAGSAACPSLAP